MERSEAHAESAGVGTASPEGARDTPAWRRLLADWTPFERAWLLVFTAVNLWLYAAWDDTLVGLVTSLTGMMTVVLVAKGKVSNYYFGVVNVVLYAYTSWLSGYYGEVMLNLLYFFPMQFVGLYLWTRHRRGDGDGSAPVPTGDVEVGHLSWPQRFAWLAVSAAAVAAYGWVLDRLGGTLPFFDSTSTVLSIIAMVLMVKRVSEQWVLWIAVNAVSVLMWLHVVGEGGRDVTMVVMWSAYLVNSVYGLYNWHRLEGRKGGEAAGAA